MGAGEIRAGKAFVEVSTKDSLTKGLAAISGKFKRFAAGIKGFGGQIQGAFGKLALGGVIADVFSVAGLGASIKAFSEAGTELFFLSEKTGMSVEALGKLKYAAQYSGTSLEGVSVGVKKMEKFLGEVAGGSKEAAGTLRQLGLSAAELKSMTPDQQFEAFALAIAKVEDPTQKAALAMKVFGKSGTELIPLIDHYEELGAEADKFGVMSKENAGKAKLFDDAMRKLNASFKGIFGAIAGTFISDLTQMATNIGNMVNSVRLWVKANKENVHSILLWGSAIAGAGAAIVTLGTLLITGGAIASAIFGAISTAFAVVAGVIGFILSPIGLVVAAIVGLGGYFLYASGFGAKAFSAIKSGLAGLVGDFSKAFGGITAAIMRGDFASAMAVVWALIDLEWQKGVAWIGGIWRSFCAFFVDMWHQAAFGLLLVANNCWASMQTAWNDTISNMSKIWQDFANGCVIMWKADAAILEGIWAHLRGAFDKTFDANKAVLAIKARFNEERKAAGKETRGRQRAIESAQNKKNAEIEAASKSSRAAIVGGYETGATGADKAAAAATAAAQARVDAAQAAFDKAVGKAKGPEAPGYTRDYTNKKPAGPVAPPNLGGIMQGGTFSASIASRWGAGANNRLAVGIEKVADNTKKIRDAIADHYAAFK